MQQQATRPPLGMNMPFTGMQQQQQPSSSLLANALVDGPDTNLNYQFYFHQSMSLYCHSLFHSP
jgi:hypothetical protein